MVRARWAAVVLLLGPAGARADVPQDASPAAGEDTNKGPVQVCQDMVDAARHSNYDGIVSRTTMYGRTRFGFVEGIALRMSRHRISQVRCVDAVVDPTGTMAMVGMTSPEQPKLVRMPFIRENGYWRFDLKRWMALRKEGKAPMP